MKKMKNFMVLLAAVAVLTSCNNDEEMEVKDYGTKTFSADMKYESSGGGVTTSFTYKQQTYFKFGETDATAIGEYEKDSWTTFNILPKVPNSDGEMVTNANYNITTSIENWDLLFTQYVGDGYYGAGPNGTVYPYYLTGVLINTDNVAVGMQEYTASTEEEKISEAFSNLALSDITEVEYKSNIEAIGSNWKTFNMSTYKYSIKTNYFYIVKVSGTDIYKLRFTGFYGDTEKERIIKIEYALMQ